MCIQTVDDRHLALVTEILLLVCAVGCDDILRLILQEQEQEEWPPIHISVLKELFDLVLNLLVALLLAIVVHLLSDVRIGVQPHGAAGIVRNVVPVLVQGVEGKRVDVVVAKGQQVVGVEAVEEREHGHLSDVRIGHVPLGLDTVAGRLGGPIEDVCRVIPVDKVLTCRLCDDKDDVFLVLHNNRRVVLGRVAKRLALSMKFHGLAQRCQLRLDIDVDDALLGDAQEVEREYPLVVPDLLLQHVDIHPGHNQHDNQSHKHPGEEFADGSIVLGPDVRGRVVLSHSPQHENQSNIWDILRV
eukprot:comp12477_c0_seq1/m.7422 comp12477_c0_seq1/g.7422  ORF comp12477_c0_seq1/g.7422 comp12477_c0_seq1/m.7422 type:complete len:300 (+) comp12477_c0_seq1:1306-2205(+)